MSKSQLDDTKTARELHAGDRYADAHSSLPSINETRAMLEQEQHDNELLDEELAKTAEMLDRIFATIHLHIVHTDVNGTIQRANKAFASAARLELQDLVGRNLFDFIPHAILEELIERAQRTKSTAYGSAFKLSQKSFGGGYTWWEPSVAPVIAVDGELDGLVISLLDVTAQYNAQEDRFRMMSAIAATAEGIVITDATLQVIYVNPAFERISGYYRHELMGKPLSMFVTDAKKVEQLRKAMAGERKDSFAWKETARSIRKDGGQYDAERSISPMFDSPETEEFSGYVLVERDVTRERQLEKKLQRSQKMEALGTLAGGVAHDLNNMLVPILLNAEILEEDLADMPQSQHFIKQIIAAARRGKDLVEQVVMFSKPKGQQYTPLTIVPLIKEVVKLMKTTAPEGVRIEKQVSSDEIIINTDAGQFHRLMVNLLTNALQAVEDHGGRVLVNADMVSLTQEEASKIGNLEEGSYFRLMVEDNGPGMEHTVVERIFDPFYTNKPPKEGTGMGLAVVLGIVKGHGGAIIVDTAPGEGACFIVYIPLASSEPFTQQDEQQAYLGKGQRILVVDDEQAVGQSLVEVLKRLNYEADYMANPLDALQSFQAGSAWDLLITDQLMTELSGMELIQKVHEFKPKLPVILMSGHDELLGKQNARERGVNAYLNKPVSRRALSQEVYRVLSARDD